jgi:cation diffusion facilitator CzcD-associated flavoprotein CzcO
MGPTRPMYANPTQKETERPGNWVSILETPLFTKRRLRMICLGAGFSGLTLAFKIKHELGIDFIDFQIYEKNPELGGTWYSKLARNGSAELKFFHRYENRYPGAAW